MLDDDEYDAMFTDEDEEVEETEKKKKTKKKKESKKKDTTKEAKVCSSSIRTSPADHFRNW